MMEHECRQRDEEEEKTERGETMKDLDMPREQGEDIRGGIFELGNEPGH